jgi:hypothetical protein
MPFSAKALIDPGCTHSGIDASFVAQHGLHTTPLPFPCTTLNADGTTNAHGTITDTVDLLMLIGAHRECITFAITHLYLPHLPTCSNPCCPTI